MLSDWAGMMNGLANCGFPVKTPQESVNMTIQTNAEPQGGGEYPKDNSSPLYRFAGERAEAISQSDRAEMPIRLNAVTSPAIQFPADDRFADNICRALDELDYAEQLRLEELDAEREGLMTEMSGYPDAGVRQ